MKKIMAGMHVVFSICTALAWWGVLYPELTMTPDTYEVIWEKGAVQLDKNMVEWDSDTDIYRMILESDGSSIRFRSKFLECLK